MPTGLDTAQKKGGKTINPRRKRSCYRRPPPRQYPRGYPPGITRIPAHIPSRSPRLPASQPATASSSYPCNETRRIIPVRLRGMSDVAASMTTCPPKKSDQDSPLFLPRSLSHPSLQVPAITVPGTKSSDNHTTTTIISLARIAFPLFFLIRLLQLARELSGGQRQSLSLSFFLDLLPRKKKEFRVLFPPPFPLHLAALPYTFSLILFCSLPPGNLQRGLNLSSLDKLIAELPKGRQPSLVTADVHRDSEREQQ